MDIGEQLAHLRRTIGVINQKYADVPVPPRPVVHRLIEDLVSGEVVQTPYGCHFETEQLFASHHRHGSYEISDLGDLPASLLQALSDGAIANSPPSRWVFLDTETTGLAGGSGTYAFLIGV